MCESINFTAAAKKKKGSNTGKLTREQNKLWRGKNNTNTHTHNNKREKTKTCPRPEKPLHKMIGKKFFIGLFFC